MNCQWDDTITGPAAPTGDGCRNIVRMTGPNTFHFASALIPSFGDLHENLTSPIALNCPLQIHRWGRQIQATFYAWPAARSATGQELAEFHIPAGAALCSALIAELMNVGARMAQPGEFTLRCFLAGKIDLAQAEGVLGLIEAEDIDRLRAAIDQRMGGLSQSVAELRSLSLDLLADLEAGLDFVEENIEFISDSDLAIRISQIRGQLEEYLATIERRSSQEDLPKVVLVGPANAGKSSLFNHLAGAANAIVSEIPGTTRDYLVAKVTIGETCIELIDTAGHHESAEPLQQQADIARASILRHADLILLCLPAGEANNATWNSSLKDVHTELICTKVDLAPEWCNPAAFANVSVINGEGINSLRSAIADRLSSQVRSDSGRRHFSMTDRCRQCLSHSLDALTESQRFLAEKAGSEFVAVALRESCNALGEIVGAVYTEDLLGRIFSRFCIGK